MSGYFVYFILNIGTLFAFFVIFWTVLSPIGTYKQLIDWYNKGDLDFSEIRSVNLDEYKGLDASGEAKAEAMYQALFGPITPTVPASILQLHNNVSIVADEAALSLIIKKNLI